LGLARDSGIFKEVVFAGSTREPEKYYGASDLLVHPTFYDACSLTVLEALASGLPVVTTVSNGASGILCHGEEGWVIGNLKDGEEFKRGIVHFFDEERRRKASNRAREKAEIYSEKANFDRVITIFNEALQRRPWKRF
jgi:UDP-glucose:(heptosyl)LPS alpha-1,3-glucosyltransferase